MNKESPLRCPGFLMSAAVELGFDGFRQALGEPSGENALGG